MKSVYLTGSTLEGKLSLLRNNSLKKELESHGYEVGQRSQSDMLIMIDHNPKAFSNFAKARNDNRVAVLIRLEPPSVFPLQYSRRVESKYDYVWTPGSAIFCEKSPFFVGWPYRYNENPAKPRFDEENLLTEYLTARKVSINLESWKKRDLKIVMIGANKVSPKAMSNYQIRREFAKHSNPKTLSVYGSLWNEGWVPRARNRVAGMIWTLRNGQFPSVRKSLTGLFENYPCAIGEVPNKHAILMNAQFSLVVENSNYTVSEKILDVLINGCIPIYVGPKLSEVGIPDEVAIYIDLESTIDEGYLDDLISGIRNREIEDYLAAGEEFIKGQYFFEYWTEKSVYRRIIAHLNSQCGIGK